MLAFALMIAALICFLLAALPPGEPHHGRLVAVGLALVAGSFVLGLYPG